MKSTSASHCKDVKAFILKETFKLVLVRNLEKITVADIEAAVGFTRGSIFYHMKNKEEIIEQAIFTHLFSSFNPYFPINSLHIETLKQYIETKINHLASISHWLDKENIRINIGTTFFHILSRLENYHPEFSELMLDMQKKDKQQWEAIITMAITSREVETIMDIKQLTVLFSDLYAGCLLYDFKRKRDMQNNSLYSLYDLIKRKC